MLRNSEAAAASSSVGRTMPWARLTMAWVKRSPRPVNPTLPTMNPTTAQATAVLIVLMAPSCSASRILRGPMRVCLRRLLITTTAMIAKKAEKSTVHFIIIIVTRMMIGTTRWPYCSTTNFTAGSRLRGMPTRPSFFALRCTCM